uniref:Uncharacterized protein n=1 Tax=Arundo donax TaxID=35708 RepID=A0A0A8YEY0_ARUDO
MLFVSTISMNFLGAIEKEQVKTAS